MKKKRILSKLLSSVLAVLLTASIVLPSAAPVSAKEEEIDYTQYVKVFNNTGGDHGQLHPGALVPNGLVKLSPDTWPRPGGSGQSGYDFNQPKIRGFSHTRIEGVGCSGSGGDVRVMPSLTEPTRGFDPDEDSLYKVNEEGTTGYYKTDLTPDEPQYQSTIPDDKLLETVQVDESTKITAEMTARIRTGYHKYTFPQDDAYIYIDLADAFAGRKDAYIEVTGDDQMSGWVTGANVCGSGTYKLHFTAQFSRPFASFKTYGNDEVLSDNTTQQGKNAGAIAYFTDAQSGGPLTLKVTISPISIDQAKVDMQNESPDWDFDAVRQEAKDQWQDILSRISIEDSRTDQNTRDLIEMFYTGIYRSFAVPVNATSTEGTYMGTDGQVHSTNGTTHYDCWSLWDDFRKYPLIGLIAPERYNDIIRSLSRGYIEGIGYSSGHDQQPVPTVRYEHGLTLIADGIAKGYEDENLPEVFEAIKQYVERYQFNSSDRARKYQTLRIDKNLENSYDDYCVAIIAKSLADRCQEAGDQQGYEQYMADYETYLTGSFYYKNIWKSDADVNAQTGEDIGLFWSREADGSWNPDVTPLGFDQQAYEGSAWHWRWTTPHDVSGAIELAGGKEEMLKDLNYFFDNNWFTAVNETDLQAPYFFNYVGKPSKTQQWVNAIYTKETTQVFHNHGAYPSPVTDKVYKNQIEGYPESMDDDTGTMAAMYVAATMGIFPFAVGETCFQIGSPAFEKITFDVGAGKEFVIEAKDVSADNFYIQSAQFNGQDFNRSWIDYSEIARGGEMVFQMGDTPSTWAEDGAPAPSASDIASDILKDSASLNPRYVSEEQPALSSARSVSALSADDSLIAHWTLDGDGKDWAGDYDLTVGQNAAFEEGRVGQGVRPNSSVISNASDDLNFSTQSFSASAWFKADSNANGCIFSKIESSNAVSGSSVGANSGWSVRIDGGNLEFNILDNGSFRPKTAAPAAGTWNHVAVTREGSTAKLYLNGELVSTVTHDAIGGDLSIPSAIQRDFLIGARYQYREGESAAPFEGYIANFFHGVIDDVRVYSTALTDQQVQDLYSQTSTGEKVTVTFQSNGGSDVAPVDVASGNVLGSLFPEDPTRPSYDFDGWYLDDGTFQQPFTSQTPVEQSVTVYAKWTKKVQSPTDYLAYWPFDGNAQDTAGNIALTVGSSAVYQDGKYQQGINPNGSLISSDDARLDFGENAFSASVWYRANGTGNMCILSKTDSVANTGWAIRQDSGNLEFNILDNGNLRLSVPAPAANQWHHVAVTREGDDIKMYLDGALVAEKTVSIGTLSCNRPFAVGARHENGNPGNLFSGVIDEVKVFARALSGQEVAALFESTPGVIIGMDNKSFEEEMGEGAEDGVIANAIRFTITSGEKWTQGDLSYQVVEDGGDLSWQGGEQEFFKLSGVPEGLTPQFTRISDTEIQLELTSKASVSDGSQNGNLTISFNPDKMVSQDGSPIPADKHLVNGLISIPCNFMAAQLSYSTDTFEETDGGSGILDTALEVRLLHENGVQLADSGILFSCGAGGTLEVGKDILISNLPEGLHAVAKTHSDCPKCLTITLEGATTDRVDVSDITIQFMPSAFNHPEMVVKNTLRTDFKAKFNDRRLWFSTSQWKESDLSDGSFDQVISVEATGAAFTGENGSQLPAQFVNLPDGLSGSITKISDHRAELRLLGKAVRHDLSDSIANLVVQLDDSAFSNGDAGKITYSSKTFSLLFSDPTLSYSSKYLYENGLNDGSIVTTSLIALNDSDETFVGSLGEDFVQSDKVTVSNLPEGLQASVCYLDTNTLQLRLYGKAVRHSSGDNVECLSVVFQDNAFSGGKANRIANSALNGLSGLRISFQDEAGDPTIVPESIRLEGAVDSLVLDQSVQLTATVLPENAVNGSVTWFTSDPSVLTVDQSGKVTAVGIGSATVYAQSNYDARIKAQCTIAVTQPAGDVAATTDKERYDVNETITATIVTPADVDYISLRNENGLGLGLTKVHSKYEDGRKQWTIQFSLGTKGDRVIDVFTRSGSQWSDGPAASFEVCIGLSSPDPVKPRLYSAEILTSQCGVNEPFTVQVITSTSVEKIAVSNELGRWISCRTVGSTDEGDKRTWTIEMAVGSSGMRIFSFWAIDQDGQFLPYTVEHSIEILP